MVGVLEVSAAQGGRGDVAAQQPDKPDEAGASDGTSQVIWALGSQQMDQDDTAIIDQGAR